MATLLEYVRKNKKNRVRITFIDPDRVPIIGTIDRVVGTEYFWLLEDQKSDITRYRNAIKFSDIRKIHLQQKGKRNGKA